MYQDIVAATGAIAEQYSSPQNLQTYYSPYKADALCGFRANAHARECTGSSWPYHPQTLQAWHTQSNTLSSAQALCAVPTYTMLAILALADTISPGS